MELEEIRWEILCIGENLKSKISKVDCLIFGSILKNSRNANDIDLLIIYNDETEIQIIRKEFNSLEKFFPLHLNYFTHSEEKELNFIEEQKAEYIFRI